MKPLALVLVAGCVTMAPKYERPAAPIPASLPGAQGNAAALMPLADFVKDPKLRQILERVVAQNRSLERAVLDVESARALYRIQRATLLPTIDAAVGVTRSRQFFGLPGASTVDITEYSATVGMSGWEIDQFGRLKSQSDAKLQTYYAAVETVKATRISLIAETATAYVALAADRSRLVIARDTMDSAKRAMDLTEALVTGGTSNRGDYWQASTVYQQARGDLAQLTAAIVQDRNALELLAGGPLDDSLLPDALPENVDWFADVPVGLPSTVLLERPDVRAAEHQLQAANANIGTARAEFFPRLSLTANGGVVSAALGALFTGPTAVYTLAPTLVQPVFHGGANIANLAYAKTQKRSQIAAYELAIQTAFRETADALATRATIQEQLAAMTDLVTAADKSLELAKARYLGGIDPFLATLVSARALYASKNALIATQLAALANRVTLYRVLGGGLR